MEYLDVLDQNGVPTGQVKLRSEVHRDGDWHKSAHIWIINDNNELLIQKRSPNKDLYPNMWATSSAGHLTAGQSSIEGAMRELKEELGIDLPEDKFEYLFSVKRQSSNGTFINKEFNDVYLVKLNLNISEVVLQEEEVSEIKFVHYKELEKLVNNRQEDIVAYDEEYRRLFEILQER